MAGNNNEKSTYPLHHRMESTRKRDRNERWDDAKLDIHQMYIQEKKSLKATMAAIHRNHGLQACTRKWKNKLQEWEFTKYISTHDMQFIGARREKRRREGKDTTFFHGGTQVTPQRIDNFKKRKTAEVPLSIATPPIITYNTPSPDSEGDIPEKMCEEFISYSSSISQLSGFSVAHANSVGSHGSELETSPITKPDMQEVPPISMLDRYLSDKVQPWSQYHLSHQLGDHHTALADIRRTMTPVTEYVDFTEYVDLTECEDLSDEQIFSASSFCIDDQFALDSYPAIEHEEGSETSEVAALEDLFGLAMTLVEYQDTHGEFAPPTLKQEFELAKAVERNGNHEEAEYHCRRILDRCPQIDVQSFLGMILANVSRLEESAFLLFSALTGFIIEFPLSSLDESSVIFPPIESLFLKLIFWTDQDWTSLSSCMCQMMTAIQTAKSEGTIDQISPQLFIYGFSLAHECSILEMFDSAKYMYRALLEHSAFHLDVILHGTEKATAHRRYGILLRREEKWESSAQQLLLTCGCALTSGTHDSRLVALLVDDYADLLLHQPSELCEEDSLGEAIRKVVVRNQRQDPLHMQETSRIVEDLWPVELPAISYVAQFDLPLRAIKSTRADGECTSTASLSASVSHKYGETYTNSDVTGISDSRFMVP